MYWLIIPGVALFILGVASALFVHRRRRAGQSVGEVLRDMPIPVCVTSAEGEFIDCNPAWRFAFSGHEEEPFGGIPFSLGAPARFHDWIESHAGSTDWCGRKRFRLSPTGEADLVTATFPDARRPRRVWLRLDASAGGPTATDPGQALAVGKLAGGIAHDFKNFLTTILGNLSMLEAAATEEERQECVKDAMAAALHATELTEQLMGVSEESRVRKAAVCSAELLRSAERMVRPSMPYNVEIAIETPATGLWQVEIDRTQMERVFLNLCVNAIHAMPDGGVLRLSARNLPACTDPDGREMVQFTVEDEGVGMPPSVLNRIFEPYFSTKGKEPGRVRGLGLYVAYTILQRHGGDIRCESKVGVGTRFHMLLPRAAAVSAPPAQERRPGHRLLVVDDEAVFRRVTSELLGEHGFHVRTASNGQEALEVCTRDPTDVDLILLDLKMPVLSGSKVFRLLRERGIDTPVIVVSGVSEYTKRFEREAGGPPQAVVMKPFELDDLLDTVQRVLNNEPAMRN